MNNYVESLRPKDFSDAGNAEVFVREYGDDLVFTDSMGWLHWDGKRWARDEHKALELAEDFTDQMLAEAKRLNLDAVHELADQTAAKDAGTPDTAALDKAKKAAESAKLYLNHALKTRQASRVRAILELARPYLVRSGNTFDAEPRALNTQAGIVNLVSGELCPNQRDAYCTKITVGSRSADGSEIWNRFLDTITCEDGSLKGFLQMVIGMSLYGTVYQEGVTFAVGDGKNGKSTFFNAVAAVLGDYAGYIDIDVITTKNGNDKAALATLRGKRLVIAGELEEGRRLSAATIKKISSTDPFQVEEKYKQPEIVKPSHTLCLFTNHLPRVGSTDSGTWRRIIVVPFNATIRPDKTIQNYGEYLVEHCSGAILAWAVQGAQNFAKNGFSLTLPDCVEEATEEYRSRENWLENFIDDCCERAEGARTGARELYLAYKEWAQNAGERYIRSEKELSYELDRLGYIRITPKNKKTWLGIALSQQNSARGYSYDAVL